MKKQNVRFVVLPMNEETLTSFSYRRLNFLDSYRFLHGGFVDLGNT